MYNRIPVMKCSSCTKRLEIPAEELVLFQEIIEKLILLKEGQESEEKKYKRINLNMRLTCQQCGREKEISNEDLKALLEICQAFRYYLKKINPPAPTFQGVMC